MKVYGRKLGEAEVEIELGMVDEVVFDFGKHRTLVVSLYAARTHNAVEVRSNDCIVAAYPRAANLLMVKPERY